MKAAAFVLAFTLAGSAAAAPAPAVPARVEAEYQIAAAGLVIGRVRETFTREGDAYRLESTTRTEGVFKLFRDDTIVLRSEGRIGPAGLVPLRFEQRQAGSKGHDTVATFDWAGKVLRSEHGGETKTVDLPAGTQDRLSVMYQFMFEPLGRPRVEVYMSNGRKVDRYSYRLVDSPSVSTPAGEFRTAHYERLTQDEKENRAQLWLAAERFHLPVRVVFEDAKGLRLEQSLVSLSTR